MNIQLSARVYRDDGPRIVHLVLDLPLPPSGPPSGSPVQEFDYEITPEQLDALMQYSLMNDIAGDDRCSIDKASLEQLAPCQRYQKSMVIGDSDCTGCAICLVDFRARRHVRRLPCNHLFCSTCIEKWVSGHNAVCPICRAPVK
jgi:hypothetical protein